MSRLDTLTDVELSHLLLELRLLRNRIATIPFTLSDGRRARNTLSHLICLLHPAADQLDLEPNDHGHE